MKEVRLYYQSYIYLRYSWRTRDLTRV